MIREYYVLTKPGIIRANIFTTAAGFLFASGLDVDWLAFVGVLSGTGLVIAGACVLNNYFDRILDGRMNRTKHRALVTGRIPTKYALIYASLLEACGFVLLAFIATPLTVILGLLAVVSYVGLYTWSKRHTWHGTLIGTLPGALPIVAGYTAVAGAIDTPAIIMFFGMVCWQMAHFYAIAIFRADDYAAAQIPVLPLVKSVSATKKHIAVWVAVFAFVTTFMPVIVPMSRSYAIAMLATSTWWILVAWKGFWTDKNDRWAKKVFGSSLIVLLIWSILLGIDAWLP